MTKTADTTTQLSDNAEVRRVKNAMKMLDVTYASVRWEMEDYLADPTDRKVRPSRLAYAVSNMATNIISNLQ